ncbi:hypothetical protein NQ314_014013 [Rhamnusium bicolor]|uniref:KNTC1 first ARM-repeats domain-containing protein n=1 Tax=Rhamnusium bicolor TaxID=1586634 RepID=A0AAV8X4X8_9CUCU|nr:hypothetical protein NQ314_014013 [Rhamnusium bicolor]
MSNPVHLVELENANDEILFLSKICKDGRIVELRAQGVYETEPELKLMRLIRKHRFEEAEKFAVTFNINPIIILKARAQIFVDKTVCTSEDIINLIKILESVDDEYFKLQCCSNVECSNHEDVRKILNYGSTIMPRSNVS